ncbi:hypothetical protein PPERSA_07114 [Pseudocohnilembus persalinus]|uniref:DUF1643 domain-containing protein n=1 Tax=Pseudocohnilembus persalinus TaxID=266149 RepID=A0A0V0QXF1_PSEPJ|nr:hypothetical protein PPERSA_07114 [Pseudocohnilembus persalinus]|eukprot:KRX06951.1 hypothetical protein PPERSA_07114 [Pseudocohnilembus persalinus]
MSEEQSIPDVMIVMMNPGYNNPKNPQEEFQEGIIEIIPDITLKAIISLMEDDQVQQKYSMNWCRIINLSDYEHPNIDKFIQKFDYYCDIYDDTHSLFSDERKQEFDEIFLVSPSSIVILAWGNNPQMADLRTKAYETVQDKIKQYNNKVFGWFFQPDEKHQKLCWRYSYQRAFKQYNYQAQKCKKY